MDPVMLVLAVLLSYPACLYASCTDPGTPEHSLRTPAEGTLPSPIPIGTTLHYQCIEGYTLKGSYKITCNMGNTWYRNVGNYWYPAGAPECRVNYCEDPKILHGKISGQVMSGTHDQFVTKTFAKIICDEGYTLGGSSDENFCMPSGEWARQWQQCIAWCKASGINDKFEELAETDLCQLLRKFYGEARKENGDNYSKSSLCNIRAALQRYLASPPFNRSVNILKGEAFAAANNVFAGSLKLQKRAGQDKTQSYPEILEEDMNTLFSSSVFSLENPTGLQRLVFFNLQYMFCRRGREGLRDLRRDAFEVKKDGAGQEYLTQTFNEHEKNHSGTLSEKYNSKKKLYATMDEFCPVNTYKLYISHLHPSCQWLFQRPKKNINPAQAIWYDNSPLGHNKLGTMMKNISIDAKLSQGYTNHSIRATAIRVFSHAGVSDRMICSLSGHRNASSLAIYCSDASDRQKHGLTSILANGRKRPQATSTAPSTATRPPATATTASASSTHDRPASFYQPVALSRSTSFTSSSQQVQQPPARATMASASSTHKPASSYQPVALSRSTSFTSSSQQVHQPQAQPTVISVIPATATPSRPQQNPQVQPALTSASGVVSAPQQQNLPLGQLFTNCNFQGASLHIYVNSNGN